MAEGPGSNTCTFHVPPPLVSLSLLPSLLLSLSSILIFNGKIIRISISLVLVGGGGRGGSDADVGSKDGAKRSGEGREGGMMGE